jgi:hypothetical protein
MFLYAVRSRARVPPLPSPLSPETPPPPGSLMWRDREEQHHLDRLEPQCRRPRCRTGRGPICDLPDATNGLQVSANPDINMPCSILLT